VTGRVRRPILELEAELELEPEPELEAELEAEPELELEPEPELEPELKRAMVVRGTTGSPRCTCDRSATAPPP
jgi:hypothetical protein